MRPSRWIPALALAVLLVSPSFAAWPPGGLPVASGPETQVFQTLVPDDAGGAFVLWRGGVTPPKLQRITRDGSVAPGWPLDGIRLAEQEVLAATEDGAGGLYLLSTGREWVDYGPALLYGRRLFAHHFDRDGHPFASWPDSGVVVWSEQYGLMDDYGLRNLWPSGAFANATEGATFVLRWDRAWANEGFFFIHVDRAGTIRFDQFGIEANREAVACANDELGAFTVLKATMRDNPYYPDTISVCRYTPASGLTSWRTLQAGTSNGTDVRAIRLSPGADMLLGWRFGGERTFTLLRVNALLEPAPFWPAAGSPGELEPLCSDEQGGVFARAWDGDVPRIQRLDMTAAPAIPLWESNALPAESYRSLVADGVGGMFQVVAETNYPLSSVNTLLAFHIGADGRSAPSWPAQGRALASNVRAGNYGGYFGYEYFGLKTDPGVVLLGWTQLPTEGSDVYLQRLADDVPVPTQVVRVTADVVGDRVRIEWTLASVTEALVIERSLAGEAWQPIGTPSSGERDTWTLDDRDVHAGDELRYRLLADGRVLAGSEAEARVPLAPRFALRGFVRNPTPFDATVEFTLPDTRPARLELFDASGRLLARREVGALGAGSHRVRLGEGLALRPGLLFARLVRDGETRTAKAALLR